MKNILVVEGADAIIVDQVKAEYSLVFHDFRGLLKFCLLVFKSLLLYNRELPTILVIDGSVRLIHRKPPISAPYPN